MALFGLFGSSQPTSKAIEKQVTRVKEHYAQPDYRRAAMDQLLAWGTDESLDGVLQRLSVVVQSPHWDEEEKRWLMDEMAKKGDPAQQALIRFMMRSNAVSHAMVALGKMCSPEELTNILLEALAIRPPDDHRSSQAKMELIAALQEKSDPRIVPALIPYLNDQNDDVQCITIDVLAEKQAQEAYPNIAQMVTEDRHSPRVLRHAAGAVHRLGLLVDLQKPLTAEVAEDYAIKAGKLKPLR